MATIIRHQEKKLGLKKGEIQYSLSFAMDDDDKNVLYKDELWIKITFRYVKKKSDAVANWLPGKAWHDNKIHNKMGTQI